MSVNCNLPMAVPSFHRRHRIPPPEMNSIGMSTHLLHGFERFHVQNTSRRESIRRRGSADHLVGLEQEGWGDGEAQRLGGLQVDDELKLGGLLHREIGRLGPLEKPVHVDRDPAIGRLLIRAVGHQAASVRKRPPEGDGRQVVLPRQVHRELGGEVRLDDDGARPRGHHRCEGPVEILIAQVTIVTWTSTNGGRKRCACE